MKNSANKTPNKTWEKTKVQNLVRHKSGRYYARTFGNNKEIWKSSAHRSFFRREGASRRIPARASREAGLGRKSIIGEDDIRRGAGDPSAKPR